MYNKNEFSEFLGVSRQYLHRLITQEKIIVKKNGQIDPDNKQNADFIKSREDKQPKKVDGRRRKMSSSADVDAFSIDIHRIGQAELERRKIVAGIQEKTLKIDKERQELVSRALVSLLLSRIVAVDVNEFIPLSDSIVSEIAAIYGVNDAKKNKKASLYIRKKIFKSIEHKNKMINKYLKDIKAETNAIQKIMNETMAYIKKMLNGFKK